MIEEWKLIHTVLITTKFSNKGDKYYISNLGRCKINNKIFIPSKNVDGYSRFNSKLLHRLIYETFIGQIPKGLEIDHIDGNRNNNNINNLRLVTHKENCNNPITLTRNKGWNNMGYDKKQRQYKNMSTLRVGSKLVVGSDGKKHWEYLRAG